MSIKKLIVGVFGTANTGKSTMIEDIVEASKNRENPLLRWVIFGDDYRKIITERGLKINRDGGEESQKIIHEVLKNNIINAVKDNSLKRIIMDRTIIDSFTYTYWHYRYGRGSISRDTLIDMWEDVVRYSKLFDELTYIPLSMCDNVKVVDDKFRDTNYEYRNQIDIIMHSIWLLLSANNGNMRIISGTREGRVNDFFNTHEYFLEKTQCCSRKSELTDFENILSEREKV